MSINFFGLFIFRNNDRNNFAVPCIREEMVFNYFKYFEVSP